jgi:hypothetical protein
VSARILEHELGLSWVVEEVMERASHALVADGRVWLIDPVRDEEVLARAASLGSVAGVIQLLDRHRRDCDALAASLGVPLYPLPDSIPGAPFEVVPVLDVPGWHEAALWWPERRALVVAEVVGSSPHYTLGGARATGIHPLLRLLPPRAPGRYEPEHLLVGHGAPLHGPQATAALHEAYARSRSDIPRMLRAAPAMLGAAKGRWR